MNKMEKLNSLCIKITDGSHYSPPDTNKGFPMLSVKDMNYSNFSYEACKYISKEEYEKLKKADCKPKLNDILIAKDGSYLKHVFVIREEIEQAILSSIGILRPDLKKIFPQYLKYYLHSKSVKKEVVKKYVSGSALPRIILKNFGEIEIIIKDLPTQQKIAKVLSTIDAKIELNTKINQELEAMAKTLYDYWFVQFDFPNKQGKPYKSTGGKMVYNEELKRDIPEGWEVKTIDEWINNDKSGDWGKETEQGNYTQKVSCVRGTDLNGLNGKGEINSPTRFILEKNSHKILENHDLIIEISGGSPTQSTGRLAFITEETLERFENPLICSNFCKVVTLKKEKYLFNFVYQWNRLYDNGVLFGWEGKTSGIKNLLFESFVTNQKEVYPKADIVKRYYDFAKPIHAKKQKNLLENQQLTELRDWLLPMLMNGQVTVNEAAEYSKDFDLRIAAEGELRYGKKE
ncbi:MAG: restriction endonuclease subunit S [Chlorobi bacterium]|nr:restriction endonuclease subunit S [Chlorobiota bacterium]